jgi:hypothetical protein
VAAQILEEAFNASHARLADRGEPVIGGLAKGRLSAHRGFPASHRDGGESEDKKNKLKPCPIRSKQNSD